MGHKEIKKPPQKERSGRVTLSGNAPIPGSGDAFYPLFCFRYLHKDYGVEACINKTKKDFAKFLVKKLKHLSDQTWRELQLAKVGSEKIAKNSIKPTLPQPLSEEVGHLLSFYFAGTDARLIGHREGSVFHVYFIDVDLSVYNH